MNRFWKLSEAEVTSMQEEARKAATLRADLDRRCQAATEVICGLSNAMTVEDWNCNACYDNLICGWRYFNTNNFYGFFALVNTPNCCCKKRENYQPTNNT